MVDADLAAYFDSIPHDRLMARVAEKVSDGPHPMRRAAWGAPGRGSRFDSRLAESRYPEGSRAMDADTGLAASRRSARRHDVR